MKIAVIGAHGSGKTTIVRNLSEECKRLGLDFGVLQETAGRCPMPINRKGGIKSQMWIMARQVSEELELEHRHPIVLCDRSIIDAYIYTLDTCNELKMEVPAWLRMLAMEHAKSYDYIFKAKANPAYLKDDGVRDTGREWQQHIDTLMSNFLKAAGIKYCELPGKGAAGFIMEAVNFGKN